VAVGAEAAAQQDFADYLLRVGEGREPVVAELGEDVIRLPDSIVLPTEDVDALIDEVYGTDAAKWSDKEFIVGRAILTPKNVDVDAINAKAIRRFPGEVSGWCGFNCNVLFKCVVDLSRSANI
jgi:hypothetical protein